MRCHAETHAHRLAFDWLKSFIVAKVKDTLAELKVCLFYNCIAIAWSISMIMQYLSCAVTSSISQRTQYHAGMNLHAIRNIITACITIAV